MNINHDLQGIYPAIIKSYDAKKRTVRINIPPLMTGGDLYPEAMIAYGIGDSSHSTEVRILEGDKVWVQFVNGDARYPIVIGYRASEVGNQNEWRNFYHANFKFDALTGDFVVKAAGNVRIEAAATVTIVATAGIEFQAPTIKLKGNTEIIGSIKHNGVSIGSNHTHGGVMAGGSQTASVS